MSTRLKRSVAGVLTDISGNFVLTILNFIVTPLILHLTSASLYGFWMTILSILAYLGLVDCGIGLALVRLVIEDGKQEDEFNSVVSTAFFTFLTSGIIFLVIGLGIARFIPIWFNIPPAESKVLLQAYYIAVVSSALSLPLTVFTAVVSGEQRMAIVNTVKSVSSIVSIGISIILLYLGLSVTALALSLLFGVVSNGFINYKYAMRFRPYLNIRLSLFNRSDFNKLFSFGGYFQLGQVANIVATSADSIIIASKIGAAFVTPYIITSKLAGIVSITVASKLPSSLFPAVSQMFLLNETEKLKKSFIILSSLSSRLAIVSTFFIALSNEKLISIWVGSDFYGGMILNYVFLCWVLQDTIFRGTSMFIQASGEMRHWAIASISEAVINIVASLLLVGSLGLVGIALGTSIARTPSSIYIFYHICKKIDLSFKTFIWKGILYTMLRSLPGCLIGVVFAMWIPTSWNWLWIFLVGVIFAVLNFVSFEGIELAKPSDVAFFRRLQQVIMRVN